MDDINKLALFGGKPVVTEQFPKWPCITEDDIQAVTSTLINEELSAYEVIKGSLYDFEEELRKRFNMQYALLVGSGTAALQSAAFALGLGPGDEVIVPTITFPATASVFLHSGASVKFVDVDEITGNPSIEQIQREITCNTRAVVIAHAWGISAEVDALHSYLAKKGIALIEDGARALGSQCNGREVGTIGDVGCFSFHELKAVPAGEGGLFLTNNRHYYERAVVLGHYFRSKEKLHLSETEFYKYRDSGLGLNLKIHPIAASLARSQFTKLDHRINIMKKNHDIFENYISASSYFDVQRKPAWANRISYYGFNFLWLPEKYGFYISVNTIVSALRAEGIHASIIGNPPLFKMELFKDSVDCGPLPGKVCGSVEDKDYLGSVKHAMSLCRLPNIVEDDPKWCNYYLNALEKISCNIENLMHWECEKNTK